MTKVPLTQGLFAVIDDSDARLVTAHTWCARKTDGNIYAISSRTLRPRTIYMHRLILGEPPCEIDHRDGDGLNNRRSNLRPATRQQNAANAGPSSGEFKGVTFDKATGRWKAQAKINYITHNIGRFDSPEEAARAYDAVAFEAWGEFAYLNYPRS